MKRSFPVTLRRGDGLVVTGWQGRAARLVVGERVTFHSADEVGEFVATAVPVSWLEWTWRGPVLRQGLARVRRVYEVESASR